MLLDRTPACRRLGWVLAGLQGVPEWGAAAGQVLAPEFQRVVPVADFLSRTRDLSRVFSPLVIVGVDVGEHTARARFRAPDGELRVVGCVVESESPHRILSTWVREQVPNFLTPRLPMVLEAAETAGRPVDAGPRRPSLVVLSGVPGTGKARWPMPSAGLRAFRPSPEIGCSGRCPRSAATTCPICWRLPTSC